MAEGAPSQDHETHKAGGLSRLAGFFRQGIQSGHHHGERSKSKRPLGRTVATLAMAGLLTASVLAPVQQAEARVSTTTTSTAARVSTTTTTMNTTTMIIIMSAAAQNSQNAATRAPAEYTAMPDFTAFSDNWAVNKTGLGLVWYDDGEINYTLGKKHLDRDFSATDAQGVYQKLLEDEDFKAFGSKGVVNVESIASVEYDDGELKFAVNGYDRDFEIDAKTAGVFLDSLAEHEDFTKLPNGTVVQTDLITRAEFDDGELKVSVLGDDQEMDLSQTEAAKFLDELADKDNYTALNGETVVNVNLPTLFSYDGDEIKVYTGSRHKDFDASADDWQKLKAELGERDHYVEIPGGKKGGMMNVFTVDYAYYDRDDGEINIYTGSSSKDVDMTPQQAEAFFAALDAHDRFHAVDADHMVNNRSVLYAATDDEDLDIKIGKNTRSMDLGTSANAKAALDALQASDDKFRIFPDDDGERLVNTKAVDRAWFSEGLWWWPWDDDNLKYHVGNTTWAPDYSEADTKAYFNKLVQDEPHIVDSDYGPLNAMAVTEVWYDDGELKFRVGKSVHDADATDPEVRELAGKLMNIDLPESYDYDAMSKKDAANDASGKDKRPGRDVGDKGPDGSMADTPRLRQPGVRPR